MCNGCKRVVVRKQAYKIRFDSGKRLWYIKTESFTQWFPPSLSEVDTTEAPLAMEPKIARKAVKHKKAESPFASRTREQELAIIKAMVDSIAFTKGRHAILKDTLTRHPWMGIYFRAAYDPFRVYGLKSKHLKKLVKPTKSTTCQGLFVLLTSLQYKKLQPLEAALEWWRMLQELQPELRPIANMILDKKIGDLSFKEIDKAMRAAKCRPYIRETEDEVVEGEE